MSKFNYLLTLFAITACSWEFAVGGCTDDEAICPFDVSDVIADVMTYLKWKDVIFVCDESVAPSQRQALIGSLGDRHIATVTLKAATSNYDVIESVISSIKTTTITTILIDASPNTTMDLLQEAKHAALIRPKYEWIVVDKGLDRQFLKVVLCCTRRNVAFVTLSTTSSNATTDGSDVMENAAPFSDVMLGSNEGNVPSAASPACREVVICSYNSNSSRLEQTASWTPGSRLKVVSGDLSPKVFHHFNHAKLRVAIWEALPFTKRLTRNGTTLDYGGFCVAILKELALYLNFTYELVEPPDGQFGAMENGSMNGMVGMIVRGEVDFAVGPFTITPERELVVDFTTPYMEDGGGILTKGGDPEPDLLNVFRPFPSTVWLTVGSLIFTTSIILYVISNYDGRALVKKQQQVQMLRQQQQQQRQQQRQTQHDQREEQKQLKRPPPKWTLVDCFVVIIASLMTQGAERHPVSVPGRLVLGVWWLFTILIVSLYTASLAALLTVPAQAKSIDSIQDLAESSLQPLTVRGTNWWDLFMNAQVGVYKAVGQQMAKSPIVRVNEDALSLVYEGKGAYIMDVNQISYLYNQDCKKLHQSKTIFNNNGLGFPVPKNAFYKEAFNRVILKLQEGGFMEAWKQQFWTASAECRPRGTSGSSSLGAGERLEVVSIGGLLILYVGVVALCFVILVVQRLCATPAFARYRVGCLGRLNRLRGTSRSRSRSAQRRPESVTELTEY